MKAMVLTGIRAMEMHEVPDPCIESDTDVLVKVGAVGVCGSDVHYYTEGKIGSQVVQYPYRVGHEGAGIVEAVGAGVTRVKPGDAVAVEPAVSCYACDQCAAGRHHTCRNLRFPGCPGQAEGCMSEYIVMPEESCFPLTSGMTLEDGAISEPLAIGVYAVRSYGHVLGARVGILGAGPIGLSVMLPARAQGAERIYMTDRIDVRCAMAAQGGADWSGNPDREDITKAIYEHEPLGLDVVFECCGQQEALDQAIELLKPGGTLAIVGIPSVDRISFDIDNLRRKEIRIQNIRRQVDCVQPALDMIHNKVFDPSFMITHRFDFPDTQKAFELVSDYRDGVVKAMIHFD